VVISALTAGSGAIQALAQGTARFAKLALPFNVGQCYNRRMKLKLFRELLALCKLNDDADLNHWMGDSPLHVIICDPHGRTVICDKIFSEEPDRAASITDRSLWRFFQIDEVFDVDSIGVVAEFSKLLADQNISLFVISSYETDYLLVQPKDAVSAAGIFQQAGHQVSEVT